MRWPERRTRAAAVAGLLVAGLVSLLIGLAGLVAAGPAAAEPGESPEESVSPTPEPSPEPSESPSETATPSPTTTPSPSPSAGASAPVSVAGAVLRWGVSNQTNARSHNPGAINFLAAGVADPGRGGATLKKNQWRAKRGNVTIEKRTATGAWRTATWAGLATSPAGADIGIYGPFSDHTVVLRKGTGAVDRAAGTARVTWKGTFTVVYYGGNTVFTVTDPTLDVADGAGTLTATLGGFLADRTDVSKWQPATPQRVRIADLPQVQLGALGFTAQPAYEGVTATGSEPQDRAGSGWGAFPQPFVSYLQPFGVDQFWYSTGLQSDPTKRPLPLSVSYSPKEVAAPAPTAGDAPAPEVENDAPAAPGAPAAGAAPALPAVPAAAAPRAAAGVPAGALPQAAAAAPTLPNAVQLVAAPATDSDTAAASSGAGWFLGGALLLAAALLLAVPIPSPTGSRPTS
ncbi:hypothetical protein [Nocardioides pantholopis]|uniref:hypothetical protein n=1 Tax=Nocardioides pantholopis TaxID=2483798 RepID=UPI000FDBD445|nr:hypothetical protein [Nocardioides pantholopis]